MNNLARSKDTAFLKRQKRLKKRAKAAQKVGDHKFHIASKNSCLVFAVKQLRRKHGKGCLLRDQQNRVRADAALIYNNLIKLLPHATALELSSMIFNSSGD